MTLKSVVCAIFIYFHMTTFCIQNIKNSLLKEKKNFLSERKFKNHNFPGKFITSLRSYKLYFRYLPKTLVTT